MSTALKDTERMNGRGESSVFYASETESGKERESDGDREIPSAVRRCPRAAFPLSVSLDYLLPLHPITPPSPSLLPSSLPSCDKSGGSLRGCWSSPPIAPLPPHPPVLIG